MTTQFATTNNLYPRCYAKFVIASVACALITAPLALFAQAPAAPPSGSHSWQKIAMPTAAQVEAAWMNPPSEYGPEPYFGMNGPVTLESLGHDLDTMKSLGFRAVTAQAGGGMSTTYLTPEYFAFFKQFAEEAKKRDMKVWIVDDIGYPSGFAGGIFANGKDKHDLSMQALAITQRIPVKAGDTLDQAVSADAVAAVAISSGERTPVAIANGKIHYTASADATVAVIEHVFRTSPTKSDTNPTHQKDATQPLEDYLSPTATAAYIDATHAGYYKAMPELFGSTIMGFRGDEPDYSIAGLPWTPDFFANFQKIKGYDIRPYLGALLLSQGGGRPRPGQPFTPPAKLTDKELRAKGDYYDVFSRMFEDGFFKPQGVWCADHGVEYQVHLNHEEAEMELTRSEGDFVRDMKYVEVPGIDAIWHQIDPDTVSDYPRLAASAAHIYGRPRAFTESFAAYRPAPDITQARYILNEQMVRGVNLIETMFYPATRPEAADTAASGGSAAAVRRGGPSAVMRDPGWPALMDYTRRLSYALSMGRPAASVALYIPSSSMWMNDRSSDDTFVSAERMLSERQIDFDIINLDALATDLHAGPGTFTTDSGNSYRTVILPAPSVLSETELTRLRTFAKGGGHVLFLGSTPSLIYSRNILDARTATPSDFSFATVETSAQLEPTPTPPMQPPAEAPGPQTVPAAIQTALDKVVPVREVALDSPDTAVKVLTRHLKDADVFFFFNEGAKEAAHTVTLRTTGHTVQSWDPATGAVSSLTATSGKGSVTVKLSLEPYATQLITVR
ncbi:MAG TPA: glycosyl hydrolase [Acidobacteriaceae bacterium]|nr:glycosyl hydrolase [Acidobacteriaceae bacterium]